MSLSDLTPDQLVIIENCLRIAADRRDMFPNWEFQTIFGVTREEMAALIVRWPDIDERLNETRYAINNAMNNMLGYPHGHHSDWDDEFPFSRQALLDTFGAWRGDRPQNYFDGFE